MENNKPESISLYEHEAEVARLEVHSRRWAIAALIAFLALILTNIGWIYYENQFEDVTTTVTQKASSDGGGEVVINGSNAGAVIYGDASDTNSDSETPGT